MNHCISGMIKPLNLELFGARIRQAREMRGISQDELAALIHKDQRAISEYETGKRRLAAVEGAALNVLVNTASFDDADLTERYKNDINVLVSRARDLRDSVAATVTDRTGIGAQG